MPTPVDPVRLPGLIEDNAWEADDIVLEVIGTGDVKLDVVDSGCLDDFKVETAELDRTGDVVGRKENGCPETDDELAAELVFAEE